MGTMLCLGERVRYGGKGGGTVGQLVVRKPARFPPTGAEVSIVISFYRHSVFKIMQWGTLTTARLHEGRRSVYRIDFDVSPYVVSSLQQLPSDLSTDNGIFLLLGNKTRSISPF